MLIKEPADRRTLGKLGLTLGLMLAAVILMAAIVAWVF